MGNKSSTDIQNDIKNTYSKREYTNITSSCVQASSGVNEIILKGSTLSNVDIKMSTEINMSCEFSNVLKKISETKQNMKLGQDIVENQMDSAIFGGNKTNTKIYNKLKQSVDISEIITVYSECMQKVDFKNTFYAEDSVVTDSTFNFINKSFNECLMNSFLDLSEKHDLSTDVEEIIEKTMTNEGTSLFDISTIVIIAVIIIVIFALIRFRCKIPFINFGCPKEVILKQT